MRPIPWFRFLFVLVLALAPSVPEAAPAAPVTPVPLPEREPVDRLVGAAMGDDNAWVRLSELCEGIGHRLSGSRSLERAVVWARDAMKADGLDSVWLQPVQVPRWVRGRESATMVEPGPQTLSMLGLGRSVGTRKGGITAPVVAVTSFDELAALPAGAVKGKIVLYDVPFTTYGKTVRYRSRGANEASRRGAVAALVRSVGPSSLRTPHTGNMAAYNDSFPRIPAAAITIEDTEMIHRLLDRGQTVRVKLEMEGDTLPDGPSHNVIGEIRGRERPDEVVVIGGHLDSWDVGQGAQDDGGGCILAMETLRLLKQLGLRPRRTLRAVLWTNEENGTRGAKAYAETYGTRQRHVAAMESDGGVEKPVGFEFAHFKAGTDTTDTLATQRLVARAKPLGRFLEGLDAGRITAGTGDADTGPLISKGVPGVSHTTTMEHYFDWHHTPADMMHAVDPFELRRNLAAFAAMAWMLAEMPETLSPAPPTPAAAAGSP